MESYTPKRDIRLDLLKVLACFAVVGLHVFSLEYNSKLIGFIHYLFGYAVPVFFMVNGYLILNKEKLNYSYVFRKIKNILVVVCIWNFLIYIPKALVKHQFENPVLMILGSLVQKGFMWQFWFLGAMILTYLLAPLIHKAINKSRWGYPVILSILLVFCIVLTILHAVTGKSLVEEYFQTFRIWTWLLFFVLGGFLKRILPLIEKKLDIRYHILISSLLFVAFPIYQVLIGGAINTNDYYIDPGFILDVFCFVTCVMRLNYNEKNTAVINTLAPLGMGCYIIHPFLVYASNWFFEYKYLFLPFITFPIICVIALGATWILYRFKITRILVSL